MSKTLKEYLNKLEFVAKVKNKKTRENLLYELANDKNFFTVLKEVVENTLQKNLPVKASDKKSLKKYKRTLIEFVKPKLSKNRKKTLVAQSGGFLPILVPILTAFLSRLSQQ